MVVAGFPDRYWMMNILRVGHVLSYVGHIERLISGKVLKAIQQLYIIVILPSEFFQEPYF